MSKLFVSKPSFRLNSPRNRLGLTCCYLFFIHIASPIRPVHKNGERCGMVVCKCHNSRCFLIKLEVISADRDIQVSPSVTYRQGWLNNYNL